MTLTDEDRERIRRKYTNPDQNVTVEDLEEDLEEAGFERGEGLEEITENIGGADNLALSQAALNEAQREAVDSLSDGGAVGGELVRAEDGFTPIGSPENVSQEVERVGPNTGAVIATNTETGTSGKIGEVEIASPPEPAQGGR